MMQRALTDIINNVSLLNRESKPKLQGRPLVAPDKKPTHEEQKSCDQVMTENRFETVSKRKRWSHFGFIRGSEAQKIKLIGDLVIKKFYC